MAKFRIKEETFTRGDGYIEKRYIVQKKFLCFWYAPSFKTVYSDIDMSCLEHGFSRGALLTNRDLYFSVIENAKYALECLKNPVKINYKGDTLVRVFTDHGIHNHTYINENVWAFTNFNSKIAYECGTLEYLKSQVDRREIKKEVNYIK